MVLEQPNTLFQDELYVLCPPARTKLIKRVRELFVCCVLKLMSVFLRYVVGVFVCHFLTASCVDMLWQVESADETMHDRIERAKALDIINHAKQKIFHFIVK